MFIIDWLQEQMSRPIVVHTLSICDKCHIVAVFLNESFNHINLFNKQLCSIFVLRSTWYISWPKLIGTGSDHLLPLSIYNQHYWKNLESLFGLQIGKKYFRQDLWPFWFFRNVHYRLTMGADDHAHMYV